jgi:hypothetical protein
MSKKPNPAHRDIFHSGTYKAVVSEGYRVTVWKGRKKVGAWVIAPPMYELKLGTWGPSDVAAAGIKTAKERERNQGKKSGADHQDPILALFNYHGGQGTALYGVASTLNAGRTPTDDAIDEAITDLEIYARKTKSRKDKLEIAELIDYLGSIKGGRSSNSRRVGRSKPRSGGRSSSSGMQTSRLANKLKRA